MNTTPPDRWVHHPLAAIARTVLATLVGLLAWTVFPVALGWQPSVVMSGSMEPAIRVGDVVLTREVPVEQFQPGHVLLVEDPAAPGYRVMHRYDHLDEHGGLILRGDANRQADSTSVTAEDVLGVGVLRVPWVGLPYVWAAEGGYLRVGLAALSVVVLVALSPLRERYETAPGSANPNLGLEPGDEGDGSGNDTSSPGEGGWSDEHAAHLDRTLAAPIESSPVRAQHAVVAAIATLLVTGGAAGALTTPATATFTDTVSMTATFTTGTWHQPDAAVPESDSVGD